MKTYSLDLRQRVLAILRKGDLTQPEVAQLFAISLSTVEKWWHQWRTTRRVKPRRRRHAGRRRKLAGYDKFLRGEIKRQPDLTLAELCDRIAAEHQEQVSVSMVCRELQRLRLPRKKKSVVESHQRTARVRRLRGKFKKRQRDELATLANKLYFIDEFGVHLGLTRPCGRAAPGKRVVEATPGFSGPHYTGIAALSLQGIQAPWIFEGGMNADMFETYVVQVLLPTLHRGDLVVLDNLAAHKREALRIQVEAHGIRLIFLPPYSPDFNPIELCWAKVKTALRAAKARTWDALVTALAEALRSVSKEDARAWLAHCGY